MRKVPLVSSLKAGQRLAQSSRHPPSFLQLKTLAAQCRSPKQYRALLDCLKTYIPYSSLFCGWGYRSHKAIGFVFNYGYPIEFVRWYLTNGVIWKGPIFHEWLRTRKVQVSLDVAKRLKDRFDPELLEWMRKFDLEYSLGGGVIRNDVWIYFSMNMASDRKCRSHLMRFQLIVPILSEALKRSCPRPLLSHRETAIMERRAMGELIKQIAAAEGISGRTVRMHLQNAKRKLYTNDLINAVVIAVRSGMIDRTWKKWQWRKETQMSVHKKTKTSGGAL